MRRRRREDTDIDQYLYPKLEAMGIPRTNVRRNIATALSGRQRGDLWVADVQESRPDFEQRILALIECKDRFSRIGDDDWQDAMSQGQAKASAQRLRAFFVTNTRTLTRCYNTADLSEVSLDGRSITDIQPMPVLRAIQTQVRPGTSTVVYRSFATATPDPKRFRASLWNIRQTFRSRGISRGSEDSMIKTTLTFCILRLISEQQAIEHRIPHTVFLWDDWRPSQLDRDMTNTIDDLTALPGYQHLQGCLSIDDRLDAAACVSIRDELSRYRLFGSDFDFFGLIYESLANSQLKKDFGEFYTPRHLIRTIVKVTLSGEKRPRPLAICDPACGTGGFLVEALLFLQRNYEFVNALDVETSRRLKEETFYGFDTNSEVAIPFARTNMMMAGNGGMNILETTDSLTELPEDEYDYVLANVPYGKYDGQADISLFSYTNQRRYELLFLEKIVRGLRPGGKAAVIVPDGLVESTSYASFRECLLHDVTMEAVVSLPHFAFAPYTTEKTYVLFFMRRRPSETGKIQKAPIWHYIVDNDGFQKGSKRYVIDENDLPELETGFRSLQRDEKAGFVSMDQVNGDTFYSLCSEFYLRRRQPIELSAETFAEILSEAEDFLSRWSKLGGTNVRSS